MKKLITTLKKEVARWARIKAAERDTSVSRLLGEILQERMQEEEGYRLAMEQYLAQGPHHLREGVQLYPEREELHERSVVSGEKGSGRPLGKPQDPLGRV
jgi:hypothetical protein